MTRFRRSLAIVAVTGIAAAAACGGDGATGPKSPIGSYTLSTVNGKTLPATLFADTGFTVDVSDGSLAIEPDGRFVVGMTSRWTIEGHASVFVTADTGKWTQTGDRLVLTYVDSTTQSASWQGNRITVADSSSGTGVATLVFARR